MNDTHRALDQGHLPGAATKARRLAEILRVDHAGELAAVRIYQGQLAVLGQSHRTQHSANLVRHMGEQEKRHKAEFDAMLQHYGARPSLLSPLWSGAGFALGAATALLGEKAAMACTVAVEEVIDAHYGKQIDEIEESEPQLADALAGYRAEEQEHRDTGLHEGARGAPAYPVLTGIIKAGCRAAIKIAERI